MRVIITVSYTKMNILLFFPPLQIILDEENTTLFQKNINISMFILHALRNFRTVNYFFLYTEYFEMVLHSIPKLLKPLQ